MSFAKLKSLIVRKSSSVKADLFSINFIFEKNVLLGIIVVHGLTKTIPLSFFFSLSQCTFRSNYTT